MNLVDKQHVARFEVGHQCGDIAGLLQHRTGRGLEGYVHLVGNDARQGGLAESWSGPKIRVWSRGSPRPRAACRKILHLVAHRLGWPTYSSSDFSGRIARSMASSRGSSACGGYQSVGLDHALTI